MITVRRAAERHLDRVRRREIWQTSLSSEDAAGRDDGFEALALLEEDRLSPGATLPRPGRQDAEVVTYVREGSLAYEDSTGRAGVIHAGEFQRIDAGRGIRRREGNASRTHRAHLFRLWLRPAGLALESGHEQRRFSAAERRGVLCLVASPDARRGSLRLRQDTLLYSALLDPGQHLVHELAAGRSAWLQIVDGAVRLEDVAMTVGDGAAVRGARAVSLTARGPAEILLVDLGDRPRGAREEGAPARSA